VILASVSLGTVAEVLVVGFFTGALARLAVPGPDPMPVWLTILIGLVGAFGGGGIAYAAGARSDFALNTIGFGVAILLVVLYRRFVQRRPVVGRDAFRFPERGIGVDAYRERLHRAGIDPDRIGVVTQMPPSGAPAPKGASGEEPTENPAHFIHLLDELHDAGILDDEEYGAAKSRLLERLRP
jgi:uncharacterized membrane protein YeaQ/YmgE (transglycosylase-associated protein family)